MSGRKNNYVSNPFWSQNFGASTGINGPTILSSTAVLYSNAIDARYQDNFAIEIKATSGLATGNFFLDNSANYFQDTSGAIVSVGDWLPPTTAFASLNATSALLSTTFTTTPWPWYRMRYIASSASSSAIMNSWVAGKQF